MYMAVLLTSQCKQHIMMCTEGWIHQEVPRDMPGTHQAIHQDTECHLALPLRLHGALSPHLHVLAYPPHGGLRLATWALVSCSLGCLHSSAHDIIHSMTSWPSFGPHVCQQSVSSNGWVMCCIEPDSQRLQQPCVAVRERCVGQYSDCKAPDTFECCGHMIAGVGLWLQ